MTTIASAAVLELVLKTRDGIPLSSSEIYTMVQGYTAGTISDASMAAWLMAVYLKGLSPPETKALTEAMLHSGAPLHRAVPGRTVVDKHSTGGVGDKTTLVVTPLLAAAGLVVPTISARSLGHSGGTLDKIEAIPGFRVDLSRHEFNQVLQRCHCAIVAQSSDIVPADHMIYALRNLTGTVESPALICASIMSKKLAEGLDALVLDVKTGAGAFMQQERDALELAKLMVDVGCNAGTQTAAVISSMDQPLGECVGNALEVKEAIAVMRGEGPHDVTDLCLTLVAHLLCAARRVGTVDEGRELALSLLRSGDVLDRFREMVSAQGGNVRVVDDPELMSPAPVQIEARSEKSGYVASIDCRRVGRESLSLMTPVALGAQPDFSTGLVVRKKLGDLVNFGESLCTIHANSAAEGERVRRALLESYQLTDGPPLPQGPLIRHVISCE